MFHKYKIVPNAMSFKINYQPLFSGTICTLDLSKLNIYCEMDGMHFKAKKRILIFKVVTNVVPVIEALTSSYSVCLQRYI